MVVFDDEADDGVLDDADGPGDEPLPLVGGERGSVGEDHDIVGPLADELCMCEGVGRAAEHPKRLVTDLVAVAVGTVEQIAAPALSNTGEVWDLVS